jgi:hypothetical protein
MGRMRASEIGKILLGADRKGFSSFGKDEGWRRRKS